MRLHPDDDVEVFPVTLADPTREKPRQPMSPESDTDESGATIVHPHPDDPFRGATYAGMHDFLRNRRGPARTYRCSWCGAPATSWALQPGSPHERVDVVKGYPRRWSPHPGDYRPMCTADHHALDAYTRRRRKADRARRFE